MAARPKRHPNTHVRIRVNERGARYVKGLVDGGVYAAHVKPRWPTTVWPEHTGLPCTGFLLEGMYELVDDPSAEVIRRPPYQPRYRVETRMGAAPDGAWGSVGGDEDLDDAKQGADWFADYHAGGRVVELATGAVVYTGQPKTTTNGDPPTADAEVVDPGRPSRVGSPPAASAWAKR